MKEARLLLEKYKAGTCTTQEMQLIDKWLLEIHKGVRSDLQLEDFEEIGPEVWNRVLQNRNKENNTSGTEGGLIKLWPRMAVAVAAAIAVIILGVWFFKGDRAAVDEVKGGVAANDIAPGKNGATLSLSNGKVIQLSAAKSGVVIADEGLAYNDGTALGGRDPDLREDEKTKAEMTATTAKGQTYQFTLPDGTTVWLNADSRISFPFQFSGKERKILLSGEAYFEVAKHKSKPFIVETAGMPGRPAQYVEVLGTHFNISSYADEAATKTTLLEGRVRLSTLSYPTHGGGKPSEAKILMPNQQATLAGNNTIEIEQVNTSEAIAWKEGNFVFNDEGLESILRKVARWYDVDIVYESKPVGVSLLGAVSRSKNVSAVLNALEQTGKVHFRIEGRRIVVMR